MGFFVKDPSLFSVKTALALFPVLVVFPMLAAQCGAPIEGSIPLHLFSHHIS